MQDSCRQAFQTEKMLALAAAEKRNNSEIEKVRQEERRKAEVDRNTMRNSFVKREQETVEDLHSLEQLHQEQCSRLVSKGEGCNTCCLVRVVLPGACCVAWCIIRFCCKWPSVAVCTLFYFSECDSKFIL